MVDKLEGGCVLCAGECRGHSLGHADQWTPEPGSRAATASPANGEQVERAFRAGWEQACITVDPCNGFHEEDYAEARSEILATLSAPTEDARERIKALEEALRRICETETKWANATVRRMAGIARTALGNKETDRHG